MTHAEHLLDLGIGVAVLGFLLLILAGGLIASAWLLGRWL